MTDFASIAAALARNRDGYTLPQSLYVSPEAHDFDVEIMLPSVWLYACTTAHVKNSGDYYLFELGQTSVIIVRDRGGDIRAFHNTCTHRGARLVEGPGGRAPRITCPYHQWTFTLDGTLIVARNMPADFCKADFGLRPVALENCGGLLFICLSDNPPPIDRVKADISAQLGLYNVDRLKVAVQDVLVEHANWKLVMENNRECYHCDSGHPELMQSLSTYGFGKGLPEDANADVIDDASFDTMLTEQRAHWQALGIYHDLIEFPDGWWHRLARLPLANGAHSQTLDGKPASTRLIWSIPHTEPTSLSIWTQPNSWHHFCGDHVVTFSLTPLAADRTLLRTSWLVHEDAEEGVDYDPANLATVWRATNAQDSRLAHLNHEGIRGNGYRQGMYSVEEKLVDAFKTFYVEASRAALAKWSAR